MSNSGVTVPEDSFSGGSVPYMQASDINDGDILQATAKMAGPNGTVILRYTLPSGQIVESPPVQAELIGKAMLGWIDQVKAYIVESAQSAAEAAMRSTRDAQLKASSLDKFIPSKEPTDYELSAAGVAMPASTQPRIEDYLYNKETPDNETPSQLAKRRIKELKETKRLVVQQLAEREKVLDKINHELLQWRGMAAATKVMRKGK